MPIETKFQRVKEWSFGKQLDEITHLARQRQSNEGYLDLETQLQRRRSIYEGIITDIDLDNESSRKFLQNQSSLFKCPKIWCEFFYDGFENKERRNQHVNQHERPFRCSFTDCLHAKLGYDTEKDLKRHERKSHPTGQDSEWAFPTPHKPKKPLDIWAASEKGDLATVKRLVEQGVDINQKISPKGSRTPLYLAVSNDHHDVVKYLLEQGCDVDKSYPGKPSAFTQAFFSARGSIVQMLLETIAGSESECRKQHAIDGLSIAIKRGREDLILPLLSYGINLNENQLGQRLLNIAIGFGFDACERTLLDNGARYEQSHKIKDSNLTDFLTTEDDPFFGAENHSLFGSPAPDFELE